MSFALRLIAFGSLPYGAEMYGVIRLLFSETLFAIISENASWNERL
jgi:hypothetical protein